MTISPQLTSKIKDQAGMSAIMLAVLLTMFVGFIAMAVDVGHVMVTRNELQNIADATSLAGARWIGNQYEGMSYAEVQAYVCDPMPVQSFVQEVATNSFAGGMDGITINAGDIRIGKWDADATPRFTETLNAPDAVNVTARRDGGANGPIATFFARIFGVDEVDVAADATAALTGQSTSGDGELELPVGISRKWFEKPEFCDQPIKFYPTGTIDGCAGWMTFNEYPASASQLRKIVDGMEAGTFESPYTVAGDSQFNFIGGNVANQLCNLKELFDQKKLEEPPYDEWETNVVVYDWPDCSNPNDTILIVGFATTIVTNVLCPDYDDAQEITAIVICDNLEPGRGGGGNYGTMGTIPGLVE
jgi:hypothetical protein